MIRVGHADWPCAGLAALAPLDPALPRDTAVAAYLRERGGDLETAVHVHAEVARRAPNLAERDHLTRQAVRLNAVVRGPVHGDHVRRPDDQTPGPPRWRGGHVGA